MSNPTDRINAVTGIYKTPFYNFWKWNVSNKNYVRIGVQLCSYYIYGIDNQACEWANVILISFHVWCIILYWYKVLN